MNWIILSKWWLTTYLLIAHAMADDCTRSLIRVDSQKDLDRIRGCPGISADISISAKASGNLYFDSLHFFGAITNEICESCHPHIAQVTNITFSEKVFHIGDIQLHGLPNLETLDTGNVTYIHDLTLSSLPRLEIVKTSLHRVWNLDLQQLPRLKNFTTHDEYFGAGQSPSKPSGGHVSINHIGLQSLDFLFNNTVANATFDIANIPNVTQLIVHPFSTRRVAVEGHNDLAIGLNYQLHRRQYFAQYGNEDDFAQEALGDLYLSNIKSLERDKGDQQVLGLYPDWAGMDKLTINNTLLKVLDIDIGRLTNLTVVNNPLLTAIRGTHMEMFMMDTVTIVNNPSYHLPKQPYPHFSHVANFTWPLTAQHLTIHGPVESEFFDTITERSRHVKSINVSSTVDSFSCSKLLYIVGNTDISEPAITDQLVCQGTITSLTSILQSPSKWCIALVTVLICLYCI